MAATVTVQVLRASKEDGELPPLDQLGPAKSELNLCTGQCASERDDLADGVKNNFGDRPDCFKSTLQEVSFVFQATMATATSSFLTGVCLIVTASIGHDLGMTQGQISWITASTSLVAGAFQLALGQLADLVGRKLMFIAGMGSFSALVLLTGFAQNSYWMLIMCGALGVPSAMVVPPAMGILGAAYKTPSRRKTSAFAAFSAGNPLGFVFGSIVCGVASSISSWRAAYIFVAIVWAVLAVFAVWAVPEVESFAASSPLTERLKAMKNFDYVGTIMTVFGTGMITASLTLGPGDGWRQPHIIALLVVGVALLLLFFVWEMIFPTPLMPPHIWKDRNFTLIIIILLLGMIGFQGSTFWLTYYMQDVQELSSLTIVAHLLPMILGGIMWNILAAKLLHRVNNTLIMAFGSAGYIAAGLLFAFMRPNNLYWTFMFPGMILTVAGGDLQNNVANIYVMQSLPPQQQSLAGGIANVVTRLGSSVAMGITTAVYTSVQLSTENATDPMLRYNRTFLTCVAFCGLGAIFIPFMRLGTQGTSPDRKASG